MAPDRLLRRRSLRELDALGRDGIASHSEPAGLGADSGIPRPGNHDRRNPKSNACGHRQMQVRVAQCALQLAAVASSVGFQEGQYILLTLEGGGEMIHEVERRLRVSEPVIKFITVRVDEEQKRLAKVKAIRATRVKRAPASAAPPPEPAGTESTPAAV